MPIAQFDKLNIKAVSIPYEEYFEEMELTDEQIQERVEAARDYEDDFLFLLSLLSLQLNYDYTDYSFTKNVFAQRWASTTSKYVDDLVFVDEYSKWFAEGAVETTLRNSDDPWMYSEDRAMFNAENEANTALGHQDYIRALMNGCTKKQWKGIGDKVERKTHLVLNDKIIPIEKYFQVGEARLLYPKMPCNHPKEVINCRCSVRYF